MLNNLKMKFARFMQGRNGVDQLSQFLNIIVLVLFVISIFTKNVILDWIPFVLMGYMYFRIG